MKKNRVIIVREQDELVAACCVPFDGEFIREIGKVDLFLSTTRVIETTGDFYQKLNLEFGDSIDLDIVDPRNQGYLIPRLIKDIVSFKVPVYQAIKTIFTLRVPAIVFNGKLVSSGKSKLSDQTYQFLRNEINKTTI